MGKKVRVLIIDDSASVRQTLTAVLQQDPDIEVMGSASDPFMAARKIAEDIPDVIRAAKDELARKNFRANQKAKRFRKHWKLSGATGLSHLFEIDGFGK